MGSCKLIVCRFLWLNVDQSSAMLTSPACYRFSTSFSFSLKMFLSSPRVDSIFSSENCCSPSAPRSLATQEFNSVTVLSRSFHSLTRVSTFFIHSSETDFTFSYLSFNPATSSSASLCVVILFAAPAASVKILRCLRQPWSKSLTLANIALASSKVWGLDKPSVDFFSAPSNHGLKDLIPVLYSAQYLTSSEKLSHSFMTFFCRSRTKVSTLLSSSL